MTRLLRSSTSTLRRFLDGEASGGILLMGVAALAVIVAKSPMAPAYFAVLKTYVGPLSVLHWINDALMAIFFLLVGLEIKREFLDGQLATWSRRALPGIAALGGMLVPGLIYVTVNWSSPETLRGWAIPAATDIAFALGVLSLLGPRVPISLKVFLAPRPTSWWQRCGQSRAHRRLHEKVGELNLQNPGHRRNDTDSDVLFAALDPADIGSIDAGGESKPLLRQAFSDPQSAQIPSEDRASIHARQRRYRRPSIDGLPISYF